jgi:hypothetical protein
MKTFVSKKSETQSERFNQMSLFLLSSENRANITHPFVNLVALPYCFLNKSMVF